MNRGGKFLVSTTILAVAACGGQDGKLEIRSTPTPLAQGKQPVPVRIAEARGQIAIGNVALALEAFRTAAREDPTSVDALVGIATCYDQMGRYDLSRRSYEAALALAPSNVETLTAFAASLQLQGRTTEAVSVRDEIAARLAASTISGQIVAEAQPVAPPQPSMSVPASAAPVQVMALQATPTALPEQAPVRATEDASTSVGEVSPLPVAVPASEAKPVSIAMKAAAVPKTPVALIRVVGTPALGPSVTVKLPPARPVQAAPAATVAVAAAAPAPKPVIDKVEPKPVPAPAPMPVQAPVETIALAPWRPSARPVVYEPAVVGERGPRLERISMGEIALITQTAKPVWVPTLVAQSQRSSTLRFVPLRQASFSPVKVRLLNAARVNRLAAQTRTWLTARGWSGVSIGNANAMRSRSLILYPEGKKQFAQRLSAQFGFPLARRASGAHVTVLLGADAARNRTARPGRA